jgi:hypothetical protein
MAANGVVTITVGGVARECKVSLQLVPEIEEATDKALLVLANEVFHYRAKLTHVAEILRVVLAANRAPHTSKQILDMIAVEGSIAASDAAAKIMNALFEPREAAPVAKRGKAKAATAATQ